ncbi:phosphotransferase enzyme family protein [Colwellia psychrerythraea]|uniref:Aminoglycoside phosphotransferase n=1 Tax=Colwellia psychrerythraea TaxID=28229 RepID=A0A099KWK6_COLPS|nr:aminoglycoside phosphotransferase family protein [Colwellia psychrerythraea]KGJ94976.1 aminoglycoside phosphotransferase [Colwellia psychrerythraea]
MENKVASLHTDIDTVLNNYDFDFSKVEITTLGNGHINNTYKLITPDFEFVLQQINHDIFPKTVELSSNAQKINLHLLAQKKTGNYPLTVPGQVLSKTGETCLKIGANYWRLMEFISGSYTLEEVESVEQAALVATAFAQFSCALSDFPANDIAVIIKDFHDISFRMAQLKAAVENNHQDRLADCQALVNFCFGQQKFIDHVIDISKKLPLHVTHNDTKINNLLFTTGDKPCAVIDLDTCMPGLLMHDFGDMVRTCCSNLAEDDTSTDKMFLKLDIFEALIQNYQNAFGDKITALEKESLIVGAKLLPFIIGTRFLTDHLNGDNYFQVSRENHNLDRAISQVQLFNLVCEAEPELVKLAQ